MEDRFKQINTINSIAARAQSDIYISTGLRMQVLVVPYVDVEKEKIDPKAMMNVIANAVGMLYADYFENDSSRDYSQLRMLAAHFIRMYLPDTTLKAIGSLLQVDHTSVIYYLTTAHNLVEKRNVLFSEKYEKALSAVTQWLANL